METVTGKKEGKVTITASTSNGKEVTSKITVSKNGKAAEARKLMALMGLGVKCGDEVEVAAEGADEDQAYEAMKAFFEANL